MIGVVSKADEAASVEEFFELFKTPWEFYKSGRRYDVVVATSDEIPDVDATLLVIYGSGTKNTDTGHGITAGSRRAGRCLSFQQILLPIYGDVLTFEEARAGASCVMAGSETAGLWIRRAGRSVLRIGYDLFEEVQLLLSVGQPVENAHIPTLDLHIELLRGSILRAGIPLLEIPPAPAGHDFAVCLTHDIDFVGIRNHLFDHTMWGFLYRSTVGAIRDLIRRRISVARLLKMWRAAVSLPFVYLGWAKDFWDPFDWYLRVEKNLPATYFLIPFKRRSGERVPAPNASRRATAYDIADLPQWTAVLQKQGCELGVHGIDSWHSVAKGREELARITAATGNSGTGIRMHWLLRDQNTFRVLEEAGYAYDSTGGYNETIGYRNGTTQVFRPLGAQTLFELPMHIQDGALFYPRKLNLTEPEASKRCEVLIGNSKKLGGVLTVLWHDRSHGPERFWGDFYVDLIGRLKSSDPWFANAAMTVEWFRKRREVRFERVANGNSTRTRLCYEGGDIQPPLNVRVYRPSRRLDQGEVEGSAEFVDVAWSGQSLNEPEWQSASQPSAGAPKFTVAT